MSGLAFTSLISLIARPSDFDGKRVVAIGFCLLVFEGKGLYLSETDCRAAITKNALWLEVPFSPDTQPLVITSRPAAASSAHDRHAALVIDADEEQVALRSLVVDAKRWKGPAANALSGRENVLGTVQRLVGQALDERDHSSDELLCRGRIALDEVVHRRLDVGERFRRPDDAQRRAR